ncbi:MAG: SDR family oxidoreductase [Gammaproteobacteria bacterium]|nr:SDR family oxidoreductase [Gammaproteobacteria bacterium]
MQRFENKVVLITGAASGIGQASAYRIAEEGGKVACVDIAADAAEKTAATIRDNNGDAMAFACDISDCNSINNTVAKVVEHYGKLDALCNIAGMLRFDKTEDVTLEDWNRIIAVNLTGTFFMCQAALPHLIETEGYIVNMASTAAHGAHAWTAAYAASKGGVMAMTRTIAIEFGRRKVNANTISPASVETPMVDMARTQLPEGADMSLLQKVLPFDGNRPPSVVASLVAFLASGDAVHINGIDVRIDGGLMA